jgi:hypothetical protein
MHRFGSSKLLNRVACAVLMACWVRSRFQLTGDIFSQVTPLALPVLYNCLLATTTAYILCQCMNTESGESCAVASILHEQHLAELVYRDTSWWNWSFSSFPCGYRTHFRFCREAERKHGSSCCLSGADCVFSREEV